MFELNKKILSFILFLLFSMSSVSCYYGIPEFDIIPNASGGYSVRNRALNKAEMIAVCIIGFSFIAFAVYFAKKGNDKLKESKKLDDEYAEFDTKIKNKIKDNPSLDNGKTREERFAFSEGITKKRKELNDKFGF